jgi:hypothetical protein
MCKCEASLGRYTLYYAQNTVLFLLEQRSRSQHQQRTLYMCRCERERTTHNRTLHRSCMALVLKALVLKAMVLKALVLKALMKVS